LKQLLKNEPGFTFAEDNKVIPLDGGETVLPLDGGETVLPLDGGETVLPLGGTGDQLINHLLDGGETVLPLGDLTAVRSAYAYLAAAVTPSAHLLLQPAFQKTGLYYAIPKATGRGVVIADLDTGVDTCHEALRGVVSFTFVTGPDANAPENCATDSTPVVPGFGHGTRVASLLRLGAPDATIWSMRVFDNSGSAQISTIYQAVVYAADHGVDVINMSFGTTAYSQTLQDAMDYAHSRGVILVAAGGNSNTDPLMYPAQMSNVAGVVAVTNGDVKTAISNYGKAADLSAPGYGLWAAHPNHKLAYVTGTSYASPLVAAEAALVIDSYQRMFRGTANLSYITFRMNLAVQPIDSLNPGFAGKLGHGRIYIPWALGIPGQ
jgi:subtilisin family serine protease